jgi:ABC-type uncharacterized transport system permease subunit
VSEASAAAHAPPLPAEPDQLLGTRLRQLDWRRVARALVATVAVLAIFSLVAELRGASALGVYDTMVTSTILEWGSLQQVLLRAVPIGLAALAVTVPARAGLVNVGGEGQLIIGAVAAAGVGIRVGDALPGPLSWLAMGLAGAAAGAAWAGLAGALRVTFGANEAVTTLLLNFIAIDVLLYLIYQPWRDPNSFGQPQSEPLPGDAELSKIFGSQLNLGVIVALVAALLIWALLRRTGWGFALRIVGGNQESARRMGLPVRGLMLSSMLVGGALAGLGGMLNFAGVETLLRPDMTLTLGYVGFLASWLGRHSPPKVVAAALLFSAIAVSSNGLQLEYGVDGTIANVLLGLVVIAPLVLAKNRKGTGA